jgi:CRISPR-associated protein Cmr6
MGANLHRLFWKTAFVPGSPAPDMVANAMGAVVPTASELIVGDSFEMTVVWPGLLMGIGYGHGIGGNNEEVKLGFSLDHTTGLPYLPGSSVKGWLRHFFPRRYKDEEKQAEVLSFLQECFEMAGLDAALVGKTEKGKEEAMIMAIQLEQLIFEGKEGDKRILSPLEQDAFFDAFPISNGHDGKLLAEDVITPHEHPLRDPVPLRMLKVAPGVTMRFQFRLNDKGLPAADKLKLFQYLISFHGIGAKTASGYGQFREGFEKWPVPDPVTGPQGHNLPAPPSSAGRREVVNALTGGAGRTTGEGRGGGRKDEEHRARPMQQPTVPSSLPWERLKAGTVKMIGIVTELTPNGLLFHLELTGAPSGKNTVAVRYPAKAKSDVGKRFTLNLTLQGKGDKLMIASASIAGQAPQ